MRSRLLAALVTAELILGCGGGGSKPISEQNCDELARTKTSLQSETRRDKLAGLASSALKATNRQTELGCS